ncbi:DUF3180 domain-containing protein [Pengzhenrongella frigida]|uniref:DUF3180 domain-containing protein n=1 Tax=Pengzhenrongella frigida TaxID=1259133 RepID=A0A4V1ZGW6_9MICO|nr:DUF3180 domain-containing protein [Cellulomonas sp. HLT2-17]RYV49974.1 DUF3180 domain-containing protein [Cellulomonas sp. HLT2-17]
MQRTRWQNLLLLTGVTGLLAWLLLRVLEGQGVTLPPVPWLVVAVLLVISVIVFTMGWAVRQFLRGRRPDLDPLRAARTAVLAKASSYTGSLLAGWYAAQVLLVVGDLDIASRRARAISAGLAVAGAVLLAVVGLIVEWFCRVPPQDKPTERTGRDSADPAAA